MLGDNLLQLMLLALGGAMVIGNLGAVLRPRQDEREGELVKAPVGRSIVMAAIGLVGVVWALVTLFSGA